MIHSYKKSGVNISEGNKFVNEIKPLVKQTFSRAVLTGIGNFGAFYEPNADRYQDPVLVSSVDGVGTKIKIAAELGIFDTVGEDLVNHCVNDIAVCGATPMFFLDYYATGKLRSKDAIEIVKGLVKGCKENSVSLIGGETAEMPGIYSNTDFDLAGAIVGIVDKASIIDYSKVKKDDVLIGFPSNGLHTNGHSLVRRVFNTKQKLKIYYPELKNTLGNELLRVHKSYLNIIQKSIAKFRVKSIAHITGGGIEGNTKRVIPGDMKLKIEWDSWKRPFIFDLIQSEGRVAENDMRQTYNLGIGLVMIVPKKTALEMQEYFYAKNEKCFEIGKIV